MKTGLPRLPGAGQTGLVIVDPLQFFLGTAGSGAHDGRRIPVVAGRQERVQFPQREPDESPDQMNRYGGEEDREEGPRHSD